MSDRIYVTHIHTHTHTQTNTHTHTEMAGAVSETVFDLYMSAFARAIEARVVAGIVCACVYVFMCVCVCVRARV